MVEERLNDGVRIAQLLASELSSDAVRPPFSVVDADPDVEPSPDGARAYRVVLDPDQTPVATVAVHPERAHAAFRAVDDTADLPSVAAEAASEAGLRSRPKAVTPPQTLVFVPDGAAVKRILPVFAAVADAFGDATADGEE